MSLARRASRAGGVRLGARRALGRVAPVVILVVALSAAASSPVTPPRRAVAAPAARPNILVIVTDDQRAKTFKYMPKTRRWFKRSGTTFRHAYATTPLCCPSRASIFTGRYVHNHGVKNNRAAAALEQQSTLQAYLQQAGYRTAMSGKYLNSWDMHVDPPYFNRFAMFSSNVARYYNSLWNVNGRVSRRSGYTTDAVKRHGVRFLRRFESADGRPWLLYLAPSAPHRPFTPERDYKRKKIPRWPGNPAVRERDRSDKPPFVQQRRVPFWRIQRIRRRQIRTLKSVDEMVNRVFHVLGQLHERRRTLAIYLSDNGFMWGEHGLALTYGKRPPYTQGMQIPLLLRWPGRVPTAVSSARLVANIDIAPTVLAAARVEPDDRWPLDGIPLIGGRARERLLLEYYVDRGATPEWASTRTRAYQYTEYYGEDGQTVGFREYYDVRKDPWQLHNRLADGIPANGPDVDALSSQLARDRRCTGAECP